MGINYVYAFLTCLIDEIAINYDDKVHASVLCQA